MPALPLIAVGVTVAAAAATAVGTYAQAQSQAKAAQYNATMAGYNAEIQKGQAQQDAANIETQGELIQGKARAAAAAAGLSGGSSEDIQYVDLVRNNQDALAASYRGTVESYNSTAEATLDNASAGYDQSAGYIGATGALLSGASKVAGSNYFNSSNTVQPVFGSATANTPPTF